MISLLKIEFFKFFSEKKLFYLYGGWICLIGVLILFLRVVASGSSFGNIFKTTSDTFSIFAVLIGVVMVLVSFNQEMQQKTMKSLLVAPVRRQEVLLSKLLVAIGLSLSILLILCLTSFVTTSVLFGFFTNGSYSSSSENLLAFTAGIFQIMTAFFTTIYFSSIILCLFLTTNSLLVSLLGLVVLRGVGELVARSLLSQNHFLLKYSPLGLLNILNPLTTNQAVLGYVLQLLLTVMYSFLLFQISCKLFARKEL